MDQTSETEKIYQRGKYDEIIQILLTAGYFRARINTLSEFDKVVGGLCWCLVSSGEVVDVDILFQENSTIGQKIALSEAIVTALRNMGCPAPLQPHQIQGGVGGADYPALHAVIVWLVKKYFERRGEREALLRAYSTFQFSKNYQLPSEVGSTGKSDNFQRVLDRNKAVRKYRRHEAAEESEETRVRACLMEFGETFASVAGNPPPPPPPPPPTDGRGAPVATGGGGSTGTIAEQIAAKAVAKAAAAEKVAASSNGGGEGPDTGTRMETNGGLGLGNVSPGRVLATGSGAVQLQMADAVDVSLAGLAKLHITELSAFEKQLAKAAREAKKEDALWAAQLTQEEAQLKQEMEQVDEGAGEKGLSGSQLGNIVSMGVGMGEIGSALAAYKQELELSRKQLDDSLAQGKLGQQAAYNRQMQNLLKQKDELGAKEREVQSAADVMMKKLSIIEEEQEGAREYMDQLRGQLKKLAELENASTQQDELKIVQDLMAQHDKLKSEETDFKTQCKNQRQEYLDKISALEDELKSDTQENAKLRDIEDMHAKISSKHSRLRQLLADVNLEVALAIRTIDDTPTRTELIQYERRFVELYQQVAWKLEETRKYYDMYNTLDKTLGFIQKEVKLLNSISDNFHEAMKSPASKLEFSKQFDSIVKGVEDSLKRQQDNLAAKDQLVEKSKQVYQNLIMEQRKYFKAVKDFQDECNKNDWLASKLEQLSRK